MKLYICAVLIVAFFGNLVSTKKCNIDCSQSGFTGTHFNVHPLDCSKSFLCENGKPKVYNCPPGKYFDYDLQACEPKGKVVCKVCSENEYGTSACDVDSMCKQDLYTPLIAHPTDCKKSYRCVDGKPQIFNCPNGYYFFEELQECAKAENDTCKPSCTE